MLRGVSRDAAASEAGKLKTGLERGEVEKLDSCEDAGEKEEGADGTASSVRKEGDRFPGDDVLEDEGDTDSKLEPREPSPLKLLGRAGAGGKLLWEGGGLLPILSSSLCMKWQRGP